MPALHKLAPGIILALAACEPTGPIDPRPPTPEAPAIKEPPANQTVLAPAPATFEVVASGSDPLRYQWRRDGAPIPGAVARKLTLAPTSLADDRARFSVVITNDAGEVESDNVFLTVHATPEITAQPQSQRVIAPAPATFSVTAAGSDPLSYQWKKDGTPIDGAVGPSYATPHTAREDHGSIYTVVVSNPHGLIESTAATLEVDTPPLITIQPRAQHVRLGETATFSVTAEGTGTLNYQWKKSGTEIPGATSAEYSTPPVTRADHQTIYSVTITNFAGAVDSTPAELTVESPIVFNPTPAPLWTPRSDHTATVLPDGRVLIAGGRTTGQSSRSVLDTAELYDPATGIFTPTDSLTHARYGHTATLLYDGRVFIAGGFCDGCGGAVARSEIYDPATGAFSLAARLPYPKGWHTATLMTSGPHQGRVVIAGGSEDGGWASYSPAIDIYDPLYDYFQQTAVLQAGRFLHTATLFESGPFAGKILLAGGRDDSTQAGALYAAELVDPADFMTQLVGSMTNARFLHTATLLEDGRVLVAGGSGPFDETRWIHPALATVEIFDPTKLLFESGGTMSRHRSGHFAYLDDGKVTFAGGFDDFGALDLGDIYDPAMSLSDLGPALVTPRWNFAGAILDNGEILLTGGQAAADVHLAGAELGSRAQDSIADLLPIIRSQPTNATAIAGRTATFSVIAESRGGPLSYQWLKNSEPIPGATSSTYTTPAVGPADHRAQYAVRIIHDRGISVSHTALLIVESQATTVRTAQTTPIRSFGSSRTLLPDGRILIAGGDGSSGVAAPEAWLFDPTLATYTPTAPMTGPRSLHRAVMLADGRILLCGGYSDNFSRTAVATAEVYDPVAGTFTAVGSMNEARYNLHAVLLEDDRVLVVGQATAEIFDPQTDTFSPLGNLPAVQNVHSVTLLADGRVLMIGEYNVGWAYSSTADLFSPATNTFSRGPQLIFGRSSHTATLLANGEVLIAGGHGASDGGRGGELAVVEIYDPLANSVSLSGPLSTARYNHTATLLPDGRVLFFGTSSGLPPLAELFDPQTRAFTEMSLPVGAYYHWDLSAWLRPDGTVLIFDHWPSDILSISVH